MCLLESLEAEIDAQRSFVFAEEPARLLQVGGRRGVDDRHERQVR